MPTRKFYSNYHAHVPMMFLIGVGSNDKDWYTNWWKPLIEPVEKVLTPKDMFVLGEACAVAYLDAGITEVWDMYFYNRKTAKALAKHGIKVHVGEVIMEPAPTGPNWKKALKEAEQIAKEFKNDRLIRPSLAVIGVYDWCSNEELLIKSIELAKKYRLPIHTHGASAESDVDGCKNLYGNLPIMTMEKYGFFSNEIPEIVIAHCAVLDKKEIEILAKYKDKVKIAVCPRTVPTINYPKIPMKELLDASVKVVLGTDGASPSGAPNMLMEIEQAKKSYTNVNLSYIDECNIIKHDAGLVIGAERERIIASWRNLLEAIVKRPELKKNVERAYEETKDPRIEDYDKFVQLFLLSKNAIQ